MKNKKGFTLIELLAVIVVLAIIALIATPIVMNVIKNASAGSAERSADNYVKAVDTLIATNKLDGTPVEDGEYTIGTDGSLSFGNVEVSGTKPNGGTIVVKDGQVVKNESSIKVGDYEVTYKDGVATAEAEVASGTTEKTLSQLITGTNACTTNKTAGACALGTMFTINVNNSETKNFYVIADEGDKVTLIMSENLAGTVAWYADAKDISHGPTTAINYLDELTDDEWSNIPLKDYTYSGIGHDETRQYEDITRNMRARMITYGEAKIVESANNGSLPTYMYGGGDYWTSTAMFLSIGSSTYKYASRVSSDGYVGACNMNDYDGVHAVRPVIELYK